MELRTPLNRVHKLVGFVYGDCRLRRDKRGVSYLDIDLLLLRPPGIRLQPLRDAPLPVRGGAQPADHVGLRHASRGLPALRHAEGREPAVGRRQAALDKGLRSVSGQLAKRLTWQNTACIFDTAWDTVHRTAGMAVARRRARISLEGIPALGVDELAGRSASLASPPCINWTPVGGCCASARNSRPRPLRASSSGSPPSAPGRRCTCSTASMSPANSAMIDKVRTAETRELIR